MPKKIAKKDLPAAADVPAATPLVERIDKRRTKLAAVKDAATKDGVVVSTIPGTAPLASASSGRSAACASS